MKHMFSVSIVIPNWNGRELLKKHLPLVIQNSEKAAIIVVDDHSTDGSVAYIERTFPNIRIIKKNEHDGFASTVNAGVQAATSDIVILLNTDVEPEKNFLDPLLTHFSDPNVFAVGCMEKSIENGNEILRGRGIGWWEKGFYHHKRGEIDRSDTAWVSGGSGAFRRSIWQELHGMDTRFDPFYWEDIDLSYRATEKGYQIIFEPKSIVRHFHEKGKIKTEYTDMHIAYIAFRNQFYFIWKHASISQLMTGFFWVPVRMVQEMTKCNTLMVKGFFAALSEFPHIFVGRITKH